MAQVCPNNICAAGCIPRSLGATLTAAASTLAYFAAAIWQFAPIVSSHPGTIERVWSHVRLALGEPYFVFAYTLVSAILTWFASRNPELSQHSRQLIAIMLNCPILIEISPEYVVNLNKDRKGSKKESDVLINRSKVEMPQMEIAVAPESKDETVVTGGPDDQEIEMSRVVSKPVGGNVPVESYSAEWAQDLEVVSDINAWTPCELPVNIDRHDQDQGSSNAEGGPAFAFPQADAGGDQDQGLRYVAGVAQRIAFGRAISPLEVILASFNFLVLLQLLLNIYACVHYPRPLLLRLSPRQFEQYVKAPRPAHYPFLLFTDNVISGTIKISSLLLFTGSFTALLVGALLLYAYISYGRLYLYFCLLSSSSAFVFCLLGVSAIILLGLLISKWFRKHYARSAHVHDFIKIYTSLVSISSILLAIAATIKCWEYCFSTAKSTANGSLFSWIVP